MEAISSERVREAYTKAPQMVRDVFGSEETVAIIMDIRSRYNLHVDVAGELGKNVGYMLLGLLSPAEFLGQMVLAGVDQTDARGVLEALNTRIFIPLQKNMKNGTAAAVPVASESASYMEPRVTTIAESVPVATPVPPKVTPVVPTPTLIEKPPLSVSNTPTLVAGTPIPEQTPSYNLIRPDALTTVSAKEPVSEMRTMQSDMQAIQHPEDRLAHYAQMPAGQVPNNAHLTPAQVFQTASVPVSRPLFTVGDAARTPIQTPVLKPIVLPAPQAPAAVPISAIPSTASTEKRSGDPYREPI